MSETEKKWTLGDLLALYMPARAEDKRLSVRIQNPGGLTAHQTVGVSHAGFGIDWQGNELVLTPDTPLTTLSPSDLEDLRKSAKEGQSWHAYQAYKEQHERIRALETDLAAARAALAKATP